MSKQAVLAFRSIGRGYSAAFKFFSTLNLSTLIHQWNWINQAKQLSNKTEFSWEKDFKEEAKNLKLYLLDTGQIDEFPDEHAGNIVAKIIVSVDGSWSTRGWSSRNGIVHICCDLTEKVLYVTRNCSQCRESDKVKERKAIDEISNVQFLEWYVKHEPNCLINHEGSASVCF